MIEFLRHICPTWEWREVEGQVFRVGMDGKLVSFQWTFLRLEDIVRRHDLTIWAKDLDWHVHMDNPSIDATGMCLSEALNNLAKKWKEIQNEG